MDNTVHKEDTMIFITHLNGKVEYMGHVTGYTEGYKPHGTEITMYDLTAPMFLLTWEDYRLNTEFPQSATCHLVCPD
jgi:hypothetical protein